MLLRMKSALRLLFLCSLFGCSRGGGVGAADGSGALDLATVDPTGDGSTSPADLAARDLSVVHDLAVVQDLATRPDQGGLNGGVLDVLVTVANNCNVQTQPPAFNVPGGTSFTVRWTNSAASAAPVDIAKIDPFNQVPIVLDLKPGEKIHDSVRAWCGALFMGTFSFRITGCNQPYLMPIDCNKP